MTSALGSITVHGALRVAAGSADITPDRTCPLAGFRDRNQAFVGIHDKLEANAVAFRFDDERCAVVLSLDTLFVGAALHSALTDHFIAEHGQRAADLLILATHTHFAPSIDASKPALGLVDPAYASLVTSRCKTLIDQVIAAPTRRANVEFRRGATSAAVNRRRLWPLAPPLWAAAGSSAMRHGTKPPRKQ